MKRFLFALENLTTRISMLISCLMMALAVTLGLFQVIMRFVLEIPAEWTEVLIRFRVGAMVSVDVLARLVSPIGKRILSFLTCVAALTLVLVIIWWGWDYATRGRMQSVIGLEGVTMFWAYLALPVGGLFCIPAIVAQFFDPQNSELEAAQ
jgi:TRAP-type C4-dicarboxylate transport system permease small subunit